MIIIVVSSHMTKIQSVSRVPAAEAVSMELQKAAAVQRFRAVRIDKVGLNEQV